MDDYASKEADCKYYYSPFYSGTIEIINFQFRKELEINNMVSLNLI